MGVPILVLYVSSYAHPPPQSTPTPEHGVIHVIEFKPYIDCCMMYCKNKEEEEEWNETVILGVDAANQSYTQFVSTNQIHGIKRFF